MKTQKMPDSLNNDLVVVAIAIGVLSVLRVRQGGGVCGSQLSAYADTSWSQVSTKTSPDEAAGGACAAETLMPVLLNCHAAVQQRWSSGLRQLADTQPRLAEIRSECDSHRQSHLRARMAYFSCIPHVSVRQKRHHLAGDVAGGSQTPRASLRARSSDGKWN